MTHRPDDAKTALEMMATLPLVVFRVEGGFGAGSQRVLFINDDISRWGYMREDFLSGRLTWPDIVHPGDRASLTQKEEGGRYFTHYRVVAKNGRTHWVSSAAAAVRDKDGTLLYTDCVAGEDMSGEAVRHQLLGEILQAVQQCAPDEAFCAILEQTGQYLGLTRVTLYEEVLEHGHSRPSFCWRRENGVRDDAGVLEHSCHHRMHSVLTRGEAYVADGEDACFDKTSALAMVALPVNMGARAYGFVMLEDHIAPRGWSTQILLFLRNVAALLGTVLQRREAEEKIREAAGLDQLTGLNNRYPFDLHLKKAMDEARENGLHGYVLFIDMDDFKVINEGYGHRHGDALLTEVAGYLRGNFADKCRMFRFSGDEFILLIGHENAQHASRIMDDILSRARHPWMVMGNEFYCTVSLGVVRFPEPGMDAADVIKNADIAIHSAKTLGKNNCVVFNRGMDNDSLRRVELEHRLRECIENGFQGFAVHYQPIVDSAGVIVGAEALLRWSDRDGNTTSPEDFIPLAEYLGLIVPLGSFVLRSAAAECRQINRQNPDFSMSINVSIRQFQQSDFVATVEEVLAETGADPANIILEVTEGMLVEDIQQMQMLLEQLRLMGVRIAMDDFGTGYSSLSNMRRLPLDIIKIDRAFVIDVTHDVYSQNFIQLITNLSHSMERCVCVEGVETAAQYSYCAECRVDRIQGYYFYKPMPRDQLHGILAQNQVYTGLS